MGRVGRVGRVGWAAAAGGGREVRAETRGCGGRVAILAGRAAREARRRRVTVWAPFEVAPAAGVGVASWRGVPSAARRWKAHSNRSPPPRWTKPRRAGTRTDVTDVTCVMDVTFIPASPMDVAYRYVPCVHCRYLPLHPMRPLHPAGTRTRTSPSPPHCENRPTRRSSQIARSRLWVSRATGATLPVAVTAAFKGWRQGSLAVRGRAWLGALIDPMIDPLIRRRAMHSWPRLTCPLRLPSRNRAKALSPQRSGEES